MVQKPTPSPNQVRIVALEILQDHPAGIRLSDLYRKTETAMRDFDINEHSVKNAVWDIDQKYPYDVIKKKNSERSVTLYPAIGHYLPTVQEDAAPYSAGRDITLDILVLKILDVVRHIQTSDFEELLNLNEEDKNILSIEQLQAIGQFQTAVKIILGSGEVLQNARFTNRVSP